MEQEGKAKPQVGHEGGNDVTVFRHIGGWLYLPAIQLVWTILEGVYTMLGGIFMDDPFEHVPEPKNLLYFSMFGFTAIFLYGLYTADLFFRKKRELPRAYIRMLWLGAAYAIADFALGYWLQDMPLSRETIKPVTQGLVACLIWIPYFRVSKRVQRTFVN